MTDAVPLPAARAAPTLEAQAQAFAGGDADMMEARLVQLAEDAIVGWRLDEAIFWQRVKFRARLIRATGGRGEADHPERNRRAC